MIEFLLNVRIHRSEQDEKRVRVTSRQCNSKDTRSWGQQAGKTKTPVQKIKIILEVSLETFQRLN